MCVLCLCMCVDWVDACVCVTIWQYVFLRGKEEVREGIHCYSIIPGFYNCLHLTPSQQNLETFGFHEKAGRNLEAYLILLQTLSCYDLERWQQLQKYWSGHCPKPRPQHQPSVSPETPPTHVPKIQVIKRPGRGPRAPLWLPSSCAWQMLSIFTISLMSPNDLTPCREYRGNIGNI